MVNKKEAFKGSGAVRVCFGFREFLTKVTNEGKTMVKLKTWVVLGNYRL